MLAAPTAPFTALLALAAQSSKDLPIYLFYLMALANFHFFFFFFLLVVYFNAITSNEANDI